jgi:deoxyinosine 3'endonuclease (endonuclease V)
VANDNSDYISTGPSFRENIESAAQYCDGFSVPLKGRSGSTSVAALFGHGGKIGRRAVSGKERKGGTKIPIFISIGHKISLQEAVQIYASVSYVRVPESVRQANLTSSQIMREKNM